MVRPDVVVVCRIVELFYVLSFVTFCGGGGKDKVKTYSILIDFYFSQSYRMLCCK